MFSTSKNNPATWLLNYYLATYGKVFNVSDHPLLKCDSIISRPFLSKIFSPFSLES